MKKKLVTIIVLISAFTICLADEVQPNTYLAKYLSFYSAIATEDYNSFLKSVKDKKSPYLQTEATIFKGRTVVINMNQVKDIDDNDIQIMKSWALIFKADDFIKIFKKKILVKEFNTEYWIIMQDKPISELQKDSYLLLYYYYIGAYNDIPIFISPGFED